MTASAAIPRQVGIRKPHRSRTRPALSLAVLCLVSGLQVPATATAADGDPSPARAERGTIRYPDDPEETGTVIHYVVYIPAGVNESRPAPAVLAGHNGGGPDDTEPPDPPDPEVLDDTLRALLDAGFIVQTWWARGFAPSEGKGMFNSRDAEVKDVQALIDNLAARPEVLKDKPGDPRVGMVGESYGGWIQLLSAAADERIDAISPRLTLYDPVQDFEPNGVLRSGWTATIAAVLAARDFDEKVDAVFREALLDGKLTDTGRDFLSEGERSVKTGLAQVRVPTLLVQGVSDTFTTANNAIAIHKDLGDRGVPTKLHLFCGGHTQTLLVGNPAGISCDPTKAPSRIPALVVNWMDAYLRGGGSRLGPPIQWELQDGSLHSTSRLPSAASNDALQVTLPESTLVRTGDPYEGVAVAATPAPDGARVVVPAAEGKVLLGVPRVTMTVTLKPETDTAAGVLTAGPTEVYVFSKLLDLDKETGKLLVIDEQATPMSFSVRPNVPETKSFDLAAIAWKVKDGHQLLYEVSPTSTDFAGSREPSISEVSATVRVPVVDRPSSP